jgi:hypothetical protein
MLKKKVGCCGALARHLRGAVLICLELFCSEFCMKAKSGKHNLRRITKIRTLLTTMLRQAQQVKAQEANEIASSFYVQV